MVENQGLLKFNLDLGGVVVIGFTVLEVRMIARGLMAAIAFGRMMGTGLIALAVVPRFGPAGMAVVFGAGLLVEKALCIAGALRVEKASPVPNCPLSS